LRQSIQIASIIYSAKGDVLFQKRASRSQRAHSDGGRFASRLKIALQLRLVCQGNSTADWRFKGRFD